MASNKTPTHDPPNIWFEVIFHDEEMKQESIVFQFQSMLILQPVPPPWPWPPPAAAAAAVEVVVAITLVMVEVGVMSWLAWSILGVWMRNINCCLCLK